MQSDTHSGQLGLNILNFARTLRAAGLPVGTGKVIDALQAARTVGVQRRDDFYWCLHAVLVNRPEQHELFDQAFHLFFRNPRILESMLSMVLPQIRVPDQQNAKPLSRRLTDMLLGDSSSASEEAPPPELELDAMLTYSPEEVLQGKDFEQMSLQELAEAKDFLKQCDFMFDEVNTRRYRRHIRGRRVDMRATLRAISRSGGRLIPLVRKQVRKRHPPLVLICDISGSMGRYSRLFLHFAHAVTNARDRVSTFVFATRLTNISYFLRHRDVDHALEQVSEQVQDWGGGTRISDCIREFNLVWSRRVLAQGAVVLFLSDGLERERLDDLSRQVERLRKSCRRLVWLNPLLRYEDFEPRAHGVRRILPHVDDFLSAHNISSLKGLGDALSKTSTAGLRAAAATMVNPR